MNKDMLEMDLRSRNLAPIPILMYHQIALAPPKGSPLRSLYVAPTDFRKQMVFLKRLGYQGLSMRNLMPYLLGKRQGKVVGITFDDGYKNNLCHALPVLQMLGFSSTCYVVSQLLGRTNEWDRDFGIPQVPLMTKEEIREWVNAGQDVGAHTRHHARLTTLDTAACQDEIALCKSELESVTDTPVEHFCYPYGDYSPENVTMACNAGFKTVTTTRRGRCHADTSMLELPRITVARRTTRLALWVKLVSFYEDRQGTR
jgi:peptidoglycan/xylan/chitin deacetylase (PgdA/CDA1 family)